MTVAQRRKQEREERRNLILDAAEQVFEAKGPDATTMDEVAAEARLGKGTLYLYFQSKDDLWLGVASRKQQVLLQRFSEAHATASDGLDELGRLLLAYAEHLATPIEHLRSVLSCWVTGRNLMELPGATEFRQHVQRTFGMFCSAIERGRSDGTIRSGPEAPRTAMHLWSAVNGALLLQLQLQLVRDGDSPLKQFAPSLRQSVEAILDGVRVQVPAAEDSSESTSSEADPEEPSSGQAPLAARGSK